MLFEIVDKRLPRDYPVEPLRDSSNASSMHWKKVDQTYCSPDQRQSFILKELGDLIGWDLATYEYSSFDDTHQYYVHHSAGYADEMFLNSEIYQAWKNRKTRGPGLLCAIGSGMDSCFLWNSLITFGISLENIAERALATTGKTTLWYVPSTPIGILLMSIA